MALSMLFFEVGLKMMLGVILVVIGSLVLREIVAKMFRIEDDTMATASTVVIWTGVTAIIFSFFSSMQYVGWILAGIANIIFILMVKRCYKVPWKTTFGIWGAWFCAYFMFALIVASTVSLAF